MINTSQERERNNNRITYAATTEGIERAEQALKRLGAKSKKSFAESRNIPRTAVSNFFNRKPMELDGFQRICDELGLLDWKEIANFKSSDTNGKLEPEQNSCHQTIDDEKVPFSIIGSVEKKNIAKLKNAIELLRKLTGDDLIGVIDIEEGSIKFTLKGSPVGLERLEQLFQLGELTEIFKRELNITVEDVSFIDAQTSENYQNNQSQKLLAFTIAGDVSQTDIDILKAALIDTSDDEEIKYEEKSHLIEEIRTQGAVNRNLSGADLSYAYLRDADLSGADLSYAYLRDADLRDADLRDADLSYAYLRDADLSRANLNGVKINDQTKLDEKWRKVWEIVNQPKANRYLNGANLSGANLSYANLSGADLSYANLSGANLSYADLSGADLSRADLSRADLRDADLSGANLSGANLNNADRFSSGTNLSGANLNGANLNGANLNGANLRNVDLSGANLSYANLSGAELRDADLSGANLSGANLNNADRFSSGTNLSGANLSSANLSDANLSGLDIFSRGAYLSGANLSSANLRGANVENAHFSDSLGISESLKQDLIKRGAIFEDSPGDRSKALPRA